jgi:VWFA-related protein
LEIAAKTLNLPYTPVQLRASMVNSPVGLEAFAVHDEDFLGDAAPFDHAQVPTIAIQSAPAQALPDMRRLGAVAPDATAASLNLDTYENTYQLLCVYALYLDSNLGRTVPQLAAFAGKLMDLSGLYRAEPRDIRLTVNGYNTSGELNRYELTLQQGGQTALAEALTAAPERGSLQIGLDLAMGVQLIALQRTATGQRIFAVAARDPRNSGQALSSGLNTHHSGTGAQSATSVRDYRFTVVDLTIDNKGVGDGRFVSSAKLKFNKEHQLEIEDYQTEPGRISSVHIEPAAPKALPGTMVASSSAPAAAVPPASTPASGTSAAAAEGQPKSPPAAQAAPPPSPAPENGLPTFRAQGRLVEVDVTVRDSHGAPVTGLTATDFTVLEDGKPQTVRVFEAHSGKPPAPASPPSLPPNTYTNRVATKGEESLNVFMFDLLNTSTQDQAYARKEMLKVLKGLPGGRQISVFILSAKLDLVQGFSDKSDVLVAAVDKIMRERSTLLTTEAERQSTLGFTEEIGRIAAPTISAPGAPSSVTLPTGGGDMDLGHVQRRELSENQLQSNRTALRLSMTLEALAGISRAVAGYPGRKNLIWLAGGFPVRLRPDTGLIMNPNQGVSTAAMSLWNDNPDFQAAIRSTTSLLAAARVAVYPIDVRGVQTAGVDIGVSTAESVSFASTDNPTAYSQNLNNQSESRYQDRSGMEDVAQQTGGEVFAGNDLGKVITRSMDDGSTYYTLAYVPASDVSEDVFRKIEVKLARKDVSLAYRRGYYPVGKKTGLAALKVHPLVSAMQPGMPQSTLLTLVAEVVPPAAPDAPVKINYTIDAAGLEFTDMPSQAKRATLDYMAVAFNSKGEPVAQASNTADANLPLADFNTAQKSGLRLSQELKLPPGSYTVKIGVMDHATQKTGTLEVPVTVKSEVAQK